MIFHKNIIEIKENKIEADNAKGVSITTLVGEDQGAKNFYMRIMKIEKEGYPRTTNMNGNMKTLF